MDLRLAPALTDGSRPLNEVTSGTQFVEGTKPPPKQERSDGSTALRAPLASEIHAALPVLNPCAPPPKSAPAWRRYFPTLGSNLQLVRHALGPHESSSSVLMHLAPPAAADLSPFHPLEGRAAVSSQARSFPAALGLASYKLAVYWSDYPRHQKQSSAWNQSHSHGPTPRPSPTEIREFCAQRAGIAFQISRCRRQAPSLPLRQTTMHLSRGVCPELSFRCASPTS